jgi:hypothetical protein
MSSKLYPDQLTRHAFNDGRCHPKTGRPYTEEEKRITMFNRKQKHERQESMMAAARRRTQERLAKPEELAVQATFWQKAKSRVSNFLTRLLN